MIYNIPLLPLITLLLTGCGYVQATPATPEIGQVKVSEKSARAELIPSSGAPLKLSLGLVRQGTWSRDPHSTSPENGSPVFLPAGEPVPSIRPSIASRDQSNRWSDGPWKNLAGNQRFPRENAWCPVCMPSPQSAASNTLRFSGRWSEHAQGPRPWWNIQKNDR